MNRILSEQQMGTLKSLSALAAHDSCQIFGKWLRVPLTVKIDKVDVVPFERVMAEAAPPGPAVGLYLDVSQGVSGSVLMLMSEETAFHLVDLLLRKPEGTTRELGSMARSALLETANILACAYLNVFGKSINRDVIPGTPSLVHDLGPSILESVLSEQAAEQDSALFSQVEFVQEERRVDLSLFFLPLHTSLKDLV